MSSSSVVSWKARWGNVSLFLMVGLSLIQLGLLFLGLRCVMPFFWEAQIATGWFAILCVILFFSASNSILEFFVHRYMLHETIAKWLEEVTRRHRKHHSLTNIFLVPSDVNGCKKVRSRYPIIEEAQWEYVNFRDSLLLIFYAVNLLPLSILQWLFPGLPIVVGGYIAITISYILYEVLHMIEHKPDSWWEEQRSQNIFWYPFNMLRRFHQYHHLDVRYNMAIAGCLGFPLADILFGTYKLPREPLIANNTICNEDVYGKKPCRMIIYIDEWIRERQKRY